MNISYDHYRVFYYVAKCRNITRAAEMLCSNQPNITRTIKNLEKELGCALFFRSRHGVQLTDEGEKLYQHIRIAFAHIEAGEREMTAVHDLQQGTISIGASEIALHCLLLPMLKEYRRLYPGIHIRLHNHSTPQALTALKNHLVDIAVVTTQSELPADLSSVVLKEIPEIAVCGKSYEKLAQRQLSLAELTEYPLVCLGDQTMTYRFYSDLFVKRGFIFSPCVEAATIDQLLLLVENDLGIGFIPKDLLEITKKTESVCVLKLKETLPSRKICLAQNPAFSLSPAAQKLKEMLCQTVVDKT